MMADYTELAKRLREDKSWIEQGTTETEHEIAEHIQQAADAIEELKADKAALNGTVTNLLEQIKDLANPRWIPATERLPEEGVSVQVCFRSQGGIAQAVSERFVNDRNQSYWSGLWMKPTHWMPLPKPPKEEKK